MSRSSGDRTSIMESHEKISQSGDSAQPNQLVEARSEEETEVQGQAIHKDIDYLTGMRLYLLIFA